MPSVKRVTARKGGVCSQEFAHPSTISPGDQILVITYFPNGEHCRDFNVPPFTRIRVCSWCAAQNEQSGYRLWPEGEPTRGRRSR